MVLLKSYLKIYDGEGQIKYKVKWIREKTIFKTFNENKKVE